MIIDQNKLDGDLIPLREAAAAAGCTESELLRMAANDEILLHVALRPYTANLVAIPSHEKPMSGSRRCSAEEVPLLSPYAHELERFGKVSVKQYQANAFGRVPQWDWHYWMLEEPQIATIEHIYIARGHVTGEQLPEAKPAKRHAKQEETILQVIRDELKLDPLNLPAFKPGIPGVKSDVKSKVPNNEFLGTVFNKAWDRLMGKKELKYADKPSSP